jgi:hypothetical protein
MSVLSVIVVLTWCSNTAKDIFSTLLNQVDGRTSENEMSMADINGDMHLAQFEFYLICSLVL